MESDDCVNHNKIKNYYKKAVVFAITLILTLSVIAIADEVNPDTILPNLFENQPETTSTGNLEINQDSPFQPLAIEWDVQLSLSETGGKNDYVVFGEAPESHGGPPADSNDEPKPPNPFPPCIYSWFDDNSVSVREGDKVTNPNKSNAIHFEKHYNDALTALTDFDILNDDTLESDGFSGIYTADRETF